MELLEGRALLSKLLTNGEPMEAISPTVVGLQSLVVPDQSTALILSFSEPMDAARAGGPANYHLIWAGKDHRLGTGDDRVTPIRSARYEAASQSVKLRLMHRQPPHRTLWLTITDASPGGLTNASGTPLSGVGTGGPDSDHAIRLDLKALERPMRMGLLPDGGFETPTIPLRKKARTLSDRRPGPRLLADYLRLRERPDLLAGRRGDAHARPQRQIGRHDRTILRDRTRAGLPAPVRLWKQPGCSRRTAGATVTVTGVGTLLTRPSLMQDRRPGT